MREVAHTNTPTEGRSLSATAWSSRKYLAFFFNEPGKLIQGSAYLFLLCSNAEQRLCKCVFSATPNGLVNPP